MLYDPVFGYLGPTSPGEQTIRPPESPEMRGVVNSDRPPTNRELWHIRVVLHGWRAKD